MRHCLKTCLLLCGLLLQTGAYAENLIAEDAWVRAAPPGMTVLAAYMVLQNHGDATQLTAVSSPQFDSVEVHRTVITDGVASMEAVPALDLPMHGTVRLEPNGLHLMLFDPKAALAVGEKVNLELRFANGATLSVVADVRAAAEPTSGEHPMHEHDHPH